MKIEIRANRRDFRRWHLSLADEVSRKVPGAIVRFRLVTLPPPALPGVEALLGLERLLLRGPRQPLFDLASPPEDKDADDGKADAILDCTGDVPDATEANVPVLRPLFDGSPSLEALVGALLARNMPKLAIESVGSGAVLAVATISAEGAAGLIGGIDSVLSRTIVLLTRVLVSPDGIIPAGDLKAVTRMPSGRAALAFAARNIATDCARAIYHLCLFSPHWRIGWRLHDGPGVLERRNLGGPAWTILADPGRRFFADPFPVTWQGRTYIFFEDLDHRVGKGVISVMPFGESGPEGEAVPVIEEPWHLSYPFVISHDGDLWMVPESSLSGQVPIYRCVEFPYRWERAGTLLDGIEAADTTIVRHAGRFWMTSAIRDGRGGYSDILAIFHAETLLGPWEEHRLRPVLVDVAAARPAGAIVSHQGQLWRPIQDCTRGYGKALALARIDRLDADHFSQSIVARIDPGPLWPGGRLHTLNRSGRLECIDGTTYNPRIAALRPSFDTKMRPGGSGETTPT